MKKEKEKTVRYDGLKSITVITYFFCFWSGQPAEAAAPTWLWPGLDRSLGMVDLALWDWSDSKDHCSPPEVCAAGAQQIKALQEKLNRLHSTRWGSEGVRGSLWSTLWKGASTAFVQEGSRWRFCWDLNKDCHRDEGEGLAVALSASTDLCLFCGTDLML